MRKRARRKLERRIVRKVIQRVTRQLAQRVKPVGKKRKSSSADNDDD